MKIPTWFQASSVTLAVSVLVMGCSKPPEPVASTTPMPESQMPAANVSDVDVTERVKMALQNNDSLKPFNINVITQKGDVRLIGVLDNQAQIDNALRIARDAVGTQSVQNELTLKM